MKRIVFGIILFVTIFLSSVVFAQSFKPVVSRIGIKGDTLRFVIKSESLPQGVTKSMFEGAVMNGKMKYKADEEDKGDITVVNSEIKGFEQGDSTSVLVVGSNEHLNVQNIDDGTAKYDCDLTVTLPEREVNHRTFKVKFLRGGTSSYMRLVVASSDIPGDITANDLKNAVITGTLKHNTDEKLNLELNNRVVSAEFKEGEVVLNVADGESAAKANFTVGKAYTAELTLSIAEDAEEISIYKLTTSGVNVNCYVKNMTKEDRNNMVVIAAAYSDDELVDACIKRVSVPSFSVSEKLEFAFEPTKPWTKGKILILGTSSKLSLDIDSVSFDYQDPDFAVPDYGGESYGSVSETDWKLDEFYEKEANVRSGIPNVYSKLEKGEPLNIVFVGGSVTQGYTWCESVLRWLRKEYPNSKITDYNIGLSGTGTEVGVIRVDSDILSKTPDLVFVEYGGNGGTDVTMEGIFRKIRSKAPNTDIVMVNTMHADWYQTYKDGNLPSNIARFEKIAEHYGVPSASFGVQVAAYYDLGRLSLAGEQQTGKILYAKDGIHPTADGGQLAGGAVVRSLIRMKDAGTDGKAHTLPEAINKDNWENASSIGFEDFSKLKFEGEWFDCKNDSDNSSKYGTNYDYTGGYVSTFKKIFPSGMKGTLSAGAKVTVKFKGTTVGIFEAGGQYSGQVKVYVDGVLKPSPLKLYCGHDTKPRHQIYYIDELPYGEHIVTFELDSDMPDKSVNQNNNPHDKTYEKNELYIGRIVSDGEILEIK